mmetsp:Transcript_38628/g.91159  ORF Transcript_38628/g.91159 Transcript_38628/m.91159 type:complete len:418 (+) Transcript_38628:1170-2423(+)
MSLPLADPPCLDARADRVGEGQEVGRDPALVHLGHELLALAPLELLRVAADECVVRCRVRLDVDLVHLHEQPLGALHLPRRHARLDQRRVRDHVRLAPAPPHLQQHLERLVDLARLGVSVDHDVVRDLRRLERDRDARLGVGRQHLARPFAAHAAERAEELLCGLDVVVAHARFEQRVDHADRRRRALAHHLVDHLVRTREVTCETEGLNQRGVALHARDHWRELLLLVLVGADCRLLVLVGRHRLGGLDPDGAGGLGGLLGEFVEDGDGAGGRAALDERHQDEVEELRVDLDVVALEVGDHGFDRRHVPALAQRHHVERAPLQQHRPRRRRRQRHARLTQARVLRDRRDQRDVVVGRAERHPQLVDGRGVAVGPREEVDVLDGEREVPELVLHQRDEGFGRVLGRELPKRHVRREP